VSADTQPCAEETFKATLQYGEGYYIDPAHNGGEGLCRSVSAANVQAVRDAHVNGNWIEGDHATAMTYLPQPAAPAVRECWLGIDTAASGMSVKATRPDGSLCGTSSWAGAWGSATDPASVVYQWSMSGSDCNCDTVECNYVPALTYS